MCAELRHKQHVHWRCSAAAVPWALLGSALLPHTPDTRGEVTIQAARPDIECFVNGRGCLKVQDATQQTGATGLGGRGNDVLSDGVALDTVRRS